ncbi:hypothetical protein [Actinomadura kijaniata]|uniref:hypothetical protein n=1 Tax=Actinomadura kijaniata TaxID=46161 RepID=UPI0008312471|nr:hypothetical protein [Actinomadura kijaniata]
MAVRVLLASGRPRPRLYPDEAGYLLAARWLLGGPGADLSGSRFYQGGYALLVAPAQALGEDLTSMYRLVIVVNAVFGALAFPLGHLLLRRCGVARRHALLLSWCAALVPAATLWGTMALADTVLPVVLLGWLLAVDRLVCRGGAAAGCVASLTAAFAEAAHARGRVVLAVHVLVLAGCLFRRDRRRPALVALAVTVVAASAALFLNDRLYRSLYPGGSLDTAGDLLTRLTSLDGHGWALSGAVGQLWAMFAGTWLLAAVGTVAVVSRLPRRSGASPEDRVMAVVLLTVTSGIAYASAAALPDEHRVGNFAYGRYLACVALVYTLVGIAVLVRRGRVVPAVSAAIALFTVSAVWVAVHGGERLRTYEYMPIDFPEVGLLSLDWTELHLTRASVAAVVLLAALFGAARLGVPALASALLTVGLVALLLLTMLITRTGHHVPALAGAPTGGVAVADPLYGNADDDSLVRTRVALYAWWTEIERFDPRHGPPRPGVCTAVVAWDHGSPPASSWPRGPRGWRVATARIGPLGWAVWTDPSCPRQPPE